MKNNLKVAVIQAKVPKNHAEGENQILSFVKTALFKPLDMIGVSEECLASSEEIKRGYDPVPFLSKVAKDNRIYLFAANNLLDESGNVSTFGLFFDPEGNLVIKQKKIVLTPDAIESGVVAGDTINVVNTELGKIAMLICKDSFHRYAAWFFDALMRVKVDIVLVPSSSITVSERSINLWTDTIKTMSMLFNVFIIAPGTVGINPWDRSKAFGHALIASPQKVVLAEGSENREEVLYATLQKEHLDRLRSPEAAKWQPAKVPEFKVTVER